MTEKLLKEFISGDKKALARIITLIENETSQGIELLSNIYTIDKMGYRIGITGAPGVGKSTTVNALIEQFTDKESIGIIAVDPSSPFTGGAILGDRLRMTNSLKYENVYIRSAASRGSMGGLATSTESIATAMEKFGKSTILIETVGVGQSELDVMEIADTVIVILVPESGDSIQAMKAGIMEIGDIFVINKSDREGADRAVQYVKSVLSMNGKKKWNPPVIKMSAKQNLNADKLMESILKHKKYLEENKLFEANREKRRKKEIEEIMRDMFSRVIRKKLNNYNYSEFSPHKMAEQIMKNIEKKDMEELWKKG